MSLWLGQSQFVLRHPFLGFFIEHPMVLLTVVLIACLAFNE